MRRTDATGQRNICADCGRDLEFEAVYYCKDGKKRCAHCFTVMIRGKTT